MPTPDADLVAQTRQGDREAFGELVDRYRDMVYGLGYHLTGEFEAARDLAQEVRSPPSIPASSDGES